MQQCAHCGDWYDERLNAGRWQCAYHPGPFDATTRTFQCCGYQPEYMPTLGEPARRGCAAADHDLPVSEGIPSLLLPDRRFYWGVVRAYVPGSMDGVQKAAVRAPSKRLTTREKLAGQLHRKGVTPDKQSGEALADHIIQSCHYDADYWRYQSDATELRRIVDMVLINIRLRDPDYNLPAWRNVLAAPMLDVDAVVAEFKRLNELYRSSVDYVLTNSGLQLPRLALVARVDWGHPKAELLGGVRLWHQFAELNQLILLSQPHA